MPNVVRIVITVENVYVSVRERGKEREREREREREGEKERRRQGKGKGKIEKEMNKKQEKMRNLPVLYAPKSTEMKYWFCSMVDRGGGQSV